MAIQPPFVYLQCLRYGRIYCIIINFILKFCLIIPSTRIKSLSCHYIYYFAEICYLYNPIPFWLKCPRTVQWLSFICAGEIFHQPMIYWHEELKLERSLFMKRVKTNHFIKMPYQSRAGYNEAHHFI